MLDDATHLQSVEQAVGRVGAIILIEKKISHANQAIKGDPFQKEWPFVFHAGDSGYPHIVTFEVFLSLCIIGLIDQFSRDFRAILIIWGNNVRQVNRRQSFAT